MPHLVDNAEELLQEKEASPVGVPGSPHLHLDAGAPGEGVGQ